MTGHYIVGAGGQGRVVLEVWRAQQPQAEYFFLDDRAELRGQTIQGAKVIGAVSSLAEVIGPAVLAIGNNPVRIALARTWATKATWGQVVHPSAVVFPSATIGAGAVVFAGAIINPGAAVGAHAIINTGVVVEHDCVLEEGVSVSPGACMGGRVHIGRGAFISVGVTLAPRVRVGEGTVVGAGAVVTSDLPPGVLAYGVPARVVRPLGDNFDWRRLL